MSDTPETDAELYPMNGVDIVWPEFARGLERERDEARELLASEKITRDHVIKRGIEMQKERDEAREALQDMLSGWHYIRKVHGDLYGVGWDRAQAKAEKALEGTK
jgi:hypothetical protein